MKIVQAITLAFTGMGIIAGFVSNYIQGILLAALSALLIYTVSYLILVKIVGYKKRSWLLYNSLITFVLVWLVVWIFLFNTR